MLFRYPSSNRAVMYWPIAVYHSARPIPPFTDRRTVATLDPPLQMRVASQPQEITRQSRVRILVSNCTEWKFAEQVVDVHQEATGLAFGVYCQGRGEVWAADLRLEIVPDTVQLTGMGPDRFRAGNNNGVMSEDDKKALAALVALYASAPDEPRNLDFEEIVK